MLDWGYLGALLLSLLFSVSLRLMTFTINRVNLGNVWFVVVCV